MKFDDLKWAAGELVRAALGRQHVDCDCHPRLDYRPREVPDIAPMPGPVTPPDEGSDAP